MSSVSAISLFSGPIRKAFEKKMARKDAVLPPVKYKQGVFKWFEQDPIIEINENFNNSQTIVKHSLDTQEKSEILAPWEGENLFACKDYVASIIQPETCGQDDFINKTKRTSRRKWSMQRPDCVGWWRRRDVGRKGWGLLAKMEMHNGKLAWMKYNTLVSYVDEIEEGKFFWLPWK
jgi:hypothetical protein